MKYILLIVLRFLALLWSALASVTALAANPLQVIDFQLRWHHQFQFAGYYAALEQGYYRDEGLEVRLHEGAPGKKPVDEVLAERAQYAESNSEILDARLKGEPVVALAAIFQHSPSVLLTRKDSGINSPHDLIGKKVMMLSVAQVGTVFHALFTREGIRPNAIDIVPSSLDIEDLVSGKVAAFNSYLTNEPFLLKQRGIDYTVINPSTYGIDFYSDILFTSEQELKQHPERVEAVRRATLKGWRYAMDHPDEIINLLIIKYKVPKSREHLQFEADAMRPLILPDLIEIGHMNPGRWQHMAESFADAGMGKTDFSLDGFIYDPHPAEVTKLKNTVIGVSVFGGAVLLLASLFFVGWLRLKKEIVLRKVAEEEVRQLAYNDPLTGIPNRNTFIPYATKQLRTAQRTRQKIALCFIDLNDFKMINDKYGHKAGDTVLIHVAKALSSVIRDSDMAARMGGDEFVMLLFGVQDAESTVRSTDEIQKAIAQPIIFEGHTLVVTASIGTAIFPDDGELLDDLISKADSFMFEGKAAIKKATDAYGSVYR